MTLDQLRRKKAVMEGLAAGSSFGTAAVLIRFLVGVNIYTIAAGRLVVASVTLAAIIVLLKKGWSTGFLKRYGKEVLFLGILLGLHFVFFASSVKNTTILNATVLVNTAPAQAAIVSTLVFGSKPSKKAITGILISFFGVTIITLKGFEFSLYLLGDLMALLAAFVESVYLNYGREVRAETPILPLMFILYLISTLTITFYSFALGNPVNFSFKPYQLALVLGLGIFPTAIGHTLYFSALSGLKPFETATLALLEPICATILGIAVFGEVPDPMFVLAGTFVLCGIVLVIKQ